MPTQSSIAGLRQSAIERKHGWQPDSIRHNSGVGIIRSAWTCDGQDVLGIVAEVETLLLAGTC